MYNKDLAIKDRLEEILYANIDEAIVVSAIKEDLPKLKIVIEELLRQYS